MTDSHAISKDKSRLLFKLTEDLDKEGLERSIKMSARQLLENRFLIGIDKDKISKERLLDICMQMDMPGNYRDDFLNNLPNANIVLFGFEENKTGCVYKIYLEYWTRLKKEIFANPNLKEPVILYLGYKWNPLNNARATIADYTCRPLLTSGSALALSN